MPRRPAPGWIPAVAGCLLVCIGTAASDAEPPASTKAKWTSLDGLLNAGDYTKAAETADEIVGMIDPKKGSPDFLPQTLELVRALSRRGLAELRCGDVDAAEATLEKASRTFKDSAVQQALAVGGRRASASVAAKLVAIELAWIELVDLRMVVIIDRIRYANLKEAGGRDAGATPSSLQPDQIEEWLRELKLLRSLAAAERRSMAKHFEDGGSVVMSSPYSRALAGQFFPHLFDGLTALEVSRLPFGVPRADGPTPAVSAGPGTKEQTGDRQAWLVEAAARFKDAGKALDEAIAAASPTGPASLRKEARVEAAALESDLLTGRAAAMRQAGDFSAARVEISRALELKDEVMTSRKTPRPEAHPDIVWPLMVAAEAALDEAGDRLAAAQPAEARAANQDAARLLARAAAIPLPGGHPLAAGLTALQSRLDRETAGVKAATPRSDAADAAARRIEQAIEGSAVEGLDP